MEAKVELIVPYLKEGREWREETAKTLAVIVNNQADFKSYQSKCSDDREDFEKRITETEGFQKRQVKVAAAAGGVMSFLIVGGNKAVEKLMSIFS